VTIGRAILETGMPETIAERVEFDRVRYANCWEDADVLVAALRPAPGRRLLSIASAGDNSLALLAAGAEVVAVDLSPAQVALVELKRAAIRGLEGEALLAFLGARRASGAERLTAYRRLASALPPRARAYWDGQSGALAAGVLHCGKFEGYFRLYRRHVLPLVHRRRTVRRLLAAKEAAARREFYDRVWDTWRWRLVFRVFFSRFVLGRAGRDPEFFRYVEGSVADRILGRARHALTELETHVNPFLDYILTGTFWRNLPRYLRPEILPGVRAGLDRLRLHEGPIDAAAVELGGAQGFDGFNLSDLFEYLPQEQCRAIYARLLAAARPGARLAYWNLLVPRRCPTDLGRPVRALEEEARGLHARDLGFFYSAFVLEEVGA
jgi:S-adenosylmethionine-diacylglycerol 3-amino-3-carboxypropyl transferase